VLSEAIYAGLVVRPVLRGDLRMAPAVEPSLSLPPFLKFYIPLAMTSLLLLVVQPMGSAAVSRLPLALPSLAVWPVLSGLGFLFRSLGVAYNEVVVALLDEPRSASNLRRFAGILAGVMTLVILIVALTPISRFWLQTVSALPPELAALAQTGIWLTLPQPALAVFQSWYQGAILHGKQTRGISEAVLIYLVSMIGLLAASLVYAKVVGLYAMLSAMAISMALQTVWLWVRSRPILIKMNERDRTTEGSGEYPQIRATDTPG
jgi:hypothetical protein